MFGLASIQVVFTSSTMKAIQFNLLSANAVRAQLLAACLVSTTLVLPMLVYAQPSDEFLLSTQSAKTHHHVATIVLLGEKKLSPYIGLGVGPSFPDPQFRGAQTIEPEDGQEAGFQLSLGIDLSDRLSVELHAADLGKSALDNGETLSFKGYGASALVYFGENRKRYHRHGWSVFGRAGIGQFDADFTGDESLRQREKPHLLLGAGVEYSMQSGFALRAEGVAFDDEVTFAQLGLLYRFGSLGGSYERTLDKASLSADQLQRMTGDTDRVPLPGDRDGDGIIRAFDKCRDTPQGLSVGVDGCAVFNDVTNGIVFISGSDVLTQDSKSVLDRVVQYLIHVPDARALVSAHTDSSGNADANMELSRKRALAVAKYLVQQGVNKSRLRALAFGEDRPIEDNATQAGRSINRRVEISLIEP